MAKAKANAKSSNDLSDRQKWNKIFNSLVHLLQKQQIQLQSLAKERKLLEDRIRLQHDRWVFDVNLFQHRISQMERDFTMQEMERMVEATKADLITGLKMREAFVCKQKFETADSELADFREWFEYLSDRCSGEKDLSYDVNAKGEENCPKALKSDLIGQASGSEELTLDKNSEIASLLAEKDFVWNQYKQLESNLNMQLNQRRAEIESANEKIHTLLSSVEKLQSSNSFKDDVIETLKGDVTKLKSALCEKDEEASRLGRELEALRKSSNNTVTPVLRHCSSHSAITRSKGKNGRTIIVNKELDSLHGLEKECRSSKRKKVDTDHIRDTPRLFTSSFKVPKLKSSSPV